ncbi:MAG: hypothetical protein M3P39_11635 [Actinomycetota bacterium]|nr:hypothetical protein [Actinomycetota bacterium]
MLAPVLEAPLTEGRLGKRDFAIDLAAAWVTCSAGHIAPIRTEPSGQRASFAKAMCVGCPLRDRCLAPARGVRQVLIAPDEELLVAARQALNDPHRPSICAAPGPASNGCLACSPSATALARAATSARQSPAAGDLGRRAGQPQPDRHRLPAQAT